MPLKARTRARVDRLQETRRGDVQRLLRAGDDDPAGERNGAVEVRDIGTGIDERRMEFPADAVLERQPAVDLEAVLREEAVMPGDAVVVLFDGGIGGVVRQAEQEIGEVGPGIAAVEIEVSVVIAAREAERCLRPKPAHIAAEFEGVTALGPREVVGPLVGVGERESGLAITDTGSPAAEVEGRQPVEGKRRLVQQAERRGDALPSKP